MITDPSDPLFDPAFTPCRDERCSIDGLHREHRVSVARGRQCRSCLICNAPIVRVPRKWAHCSVCPWRIINQKKEAVDARDQP